MTSATGQASARAGRERRLASARFVVLGLALAAALVGLLLVLARDSETRSAGLPSAVALFRFLNGQPFILLFLTMAGGYALGKVEYRGISLGPSAGSLVVAIALSLWASGRHGIDFELPAFASTIFFNLFMFSIGMKVGPQFLAGLGRGAKNYLLLALLVPFLALGLVLCMNALLDAPAGAMAGVFAGANTATPGLAAANAAFASGVVSLPTGVAQEEALANLSTAFACSYCVSAVVFVVFLKTLPRLFQRDPVAAARDFEREVSGGGAPLPGSSNFWPGALPVQQRTYRIEKPDLAGKSLGELRAEHPFVTVRHLARDGKSMPLTDEVKLRRGDRISIMARVPILVNAAQHLGTELHDPSVPPLELQTVEVVQKQPAVVGRKLSDLVKDVGHGLYLNAMFRGGEEVPRGPEVVIQKGDVLRVSGAPERIERLEEHLGPVVKSSLSTDILTLALGLSLGALLGAIVVPLGNVDFTLGSLALLLVGIAISALRTRNPALGGPFPEPARQLLEDLGLNVFVLILGLNAGAGVMRAVEAGALVPMLLGTLLVSLLPGLLAFVLGLLALKMNMAELLGAVAGARCSGAALKTAQEACHSTVPAVAYPVAYAVSNLLFTLLTYVLVLIE